MKKITAFLIAVAVLFSLASCKGEDERFFDYQDEVKTVVGTYVEDGEEYAVALYFDKKEGKHLCRRIEYSSPESLSGVSFTLEGEKITAELDGIRIAYSYFEADKVFRPSDLFDLSEEEIYDIKASKKRTTAMGKGENRKWQAVTNEEGVPVEITLEDSETSTSFKIDKITFFEKASD